MKFDHFWHFSPKLKSFESRSMWFQFCCHFHPKAKTDQIFQLISIFFVFFFLLMKSKIVRSFLICYNKTLKEHFALH
ncbi:hypothetical protein Hanom_Chr07g00661741 [Helianthus anomalus]